MLDEAVYELEHRFTKFVEITQTKSHYVVQGHSRSPILVPIESSYDFLLVFNTNLPHVLYRFQVTVKLSLARGEYLTLTLSLGVIPANIAVTDISLKTRFFGLHFCRRKYPCIFNLFYVIRPESYRIR